MNLLYKISNCFQKIQVTVIIIVGISIFNFSVLSAKSTFSTERVKSALLSIIEDKISDDFENEFISLISDYEFEEDNVQAEFMFDNELKPGINTVGIKFSKDGKVLKYHDLNIRLKIIKDVWVSVRAIPSNTIIKESDLELTRISLNSEEIPLDMNEIVGMTLNRSLMKGKAISREMLSNGIIVKRGDKVTLIVQSGAVVIRCTGAALQDGSVGQFVRVKRDGSPAVISGKVTESGSVLVSFDNYTQN
jgi:flagella basal body P-ring formation protein FlgA